MPLSGARQRQRLGGEPGPCSTDRVERVVLAAQSPLAAGVAADLEYRLATLAEVAREAGAIVPGALDSPGANAARVPLRETERLAVAACARSDDCLRQYRPRRRTNDRERVLIAVRIDADHVIHPVCKHPDRSSVRSKGPMTPV